MILVINVARPAFLFTLHRPWIIGLGNDAKGHKSIFIAPDPWIHASYMSSRFQQTRKPDIAQIFGGTINKNSKMTAMFSFWDRWNWLTVYDACIHGFLASWKWSYDLRMWCIILALLPLLPSFLSGLIDSWKRQPRSYTRAHTMHVDWEWTWQLTQWKTIEYKEYPYRMSLWYCVLLVFATSS